MENNKGKTSKIPDAFKQASIGEQMHMLAYEECEGVLNDYPYADEKYAEGFKWLKEQADAGRREYQCQYGNVLIWAVGDLAGIEYLKRSYENGCVEAAYSLGDLYAYDADWGDEFQPDIDEAIFWFERSEQLGSISAADRLGELLYPAAVRRFKNGTGIDFVRRVVVLAQKAAEAGYACSQMRLAAMYADGMVAEGADENVDSEAEARYWLLMAEECGSDLAHQFIGLILSGCSAKEAVDSCREKIS